MPSFVAEQVRSPVQTSPYSSNLNPPKCTADDATTHEILSAGISSITTSNECIARTARFSKQAPPKMISIPTHPERFKQSKRASFVEFVKLQEPSARALREFAEQEQKKLSATQTGFASSQTLSQKLPAHAPSVKSKWDGVPTPSYRKELGSQRSRTAYQQSLPISPSPITPWSATSPDMSSFNFQISPRDRQAPTPSSHRSSVQFIAQDSQDQARNVRSKRSSRLGRSISVFMKHATTIERAVEAKPSHATKDQTKLSSRSSFLNLPMSRPDKSHTSNPSSRNIPTDLPALDDAESNPSSPYDMGPKTPDSVGLELLLRPDASVFDGTGTSWIDNWESLIVGSLGPDVIDTPVDHVNSSTDPPESSRSIVGRSGLPQSKEIPDPSFAKPYASQFEQNLASMNKLRTRDLSTSEPQQQQQMSSTAYPETASDSHPEPTLPSRPDEFLLGDESIGSPDSIVDISTLVPFEEEEEDGETSLMSPTIAVIARPKPLDTASIASSSAATAAAVLSGEWTMSPKQRLGFGGKLRKGPDAPWENFDHFTGSAEEPGHFRNSPATTTERTKLKRLSMKLKWT